MDFFFNRKCNHIGIGKYLKKREGKFYPLHKFLNLV